MREMAEADLGGRPARGPTARGEWQPASLPKPSPLFAWPLKLRPAMKVLFGHDGLLWPKNAIYVGIAVLAWLFVTPDLAQHLRGGLDRRVLPAQRRAAADRSRRTPPAALRPGGPRASATSTTRAG